MEIKEKLYYTLPSQLAEVASFFARPGYDQSVLVIHKSF